MLIKLSKRTLLIDIIAPEKEKINMLNQIFIKKYASLSREFYVKG